MLRMRNVATNRLAAEVQHEWQIVLRVVWALTGSITVRREETLSYLSEHTHRIHG